MCLHGCHTVLPLRVRLQLHEVGWDVAGAKRILHRTFYSVSVISGIEDGMELVRTQYFSLGGGGGVG
jgi:hypothetical protein